MNNFKGFDAPIIDIDGKQLKIGDKVKATWPGERNETYIGTLSYDDRYNRFILRGDGGGLDLRNVRRFELIRRV